MQLKQIASGVWGVEVPEYSYAFEVYGDTLRYNCVGRLSFPLPHSSFTIIGMSGEMSEEQALGVVKAPMTTGRELSSVYYDYVHRGYMGSSASYSLTTLLHSHSLPPSVLILKEIKAATAIV